ncbi:MAG: ATP-binding cassette domain-containing protein [Desulfobacteraceae bacterium]|nr:ATP-binding cassette domain-containing protein [Desulfobacteraceae bacterium]
MTAVYQLKNIRHFYNDRKVLNIDDLTIEKGSITGLVGPNGSGKSTLLKLLIFAERPSLGEIYFRGKIELPFSKAIRSKVTLLTQKPYLLKRTVYDNIAYGLNIRKDKNDVIRRIKTALSKVGLDFERFAPRKWHELSGGEAQRVAMAARLVLEPDVLLLDEPVASVDMESAKLIRNATLKACEEWGTTLVIASHDLQWLFSISDTQIFIFNGKIFPTGVENIITGPFETHNGNQFIKKLSDGQFLVLPEGGKGKTAALIKKKNISIDQDKKQLNNGFNQCEGTITSMFFEKKKERISANIGLNDLSFTLNFSPDQISRLDLQPGKKIILTFKIDHMEWM